MPIVIDLPPDIAHAALIELKYLKPGDPAPTPDDLSAIKAEAVRQLDLYSADPDLAAEWRLAPSGSVSLHRLVLIFKGGDCILNEEV